MPRPYRDALLVEDRRHVVRMDVREVERYHASSVLRVGRAVDLQVRDARHLVEGVPEELHLVPPDLLHTEGVEVIDRDAEPYGVGDVGRPRLELVGDVVPTRPVEVDLLDHVTAALEWVHRVEEFSPAVE